MSQKRHDYDGDALRLLDVLAQDVGVTAVFSDWPATTTFYAHCTDLDRYEGVQGGVESFTRSLIINHASSNVDNWSA